METIDVYREQIIDADKKGLHVVAVPLQTLKELIGAAEMLQELYRAMPDCEGGRLGTAAMHSRRILSKLGLSILENS